MSIAIRLFAPGFLLAALPAAAAQQMVEAPIYKSWAGRPVGTVVVFRSVTEAKGERLETTIRHKLVGLDARKAVVEVSRTDSGSEEPEAQEFTHNRMFPVPAGGRPEDVGRPKDPLDQGEEVVAIAGKEYQAVWFDQKQRTEAGESIVRTWICDEVPGRLLKSKTRTPAVDKVATLELVEIIEP